jgi:hypothetical protein
MDDRENPHPDILSQQSRHRIGTFASCSARISSLGFCGMTYLSNWQPLLELAPDDIEDFMWMFVAELEDGSCAHAYKHRWTRRYLFLGEDGRAFDEVRPGRFEEVEPRLLLEEAMGAWP